MREFLTALALGIKTKDIPRSFLALVETLREKGALQAKGERIFLDSAFRVGVLDISREGAGFLESFGSSGKDLLIQKSDLKGAFKGDVVLARRVYSHKGGRPSAKVVEVLEKKNAILVAYLDRHAGRIEALDIKNGLSLPLNASAKSLKALPPQTVIRLDVREGRIIEVLGVLSDPRVDEKISLALFNKREPFPKECEEQAESFGRKVEASMYPTRQDFRSLPFCTIDPIDAKDHDDAVYFDAKESILYVAIADVSEYVTPHSPIDKEARARGFTIYLPHKSIPMLPRNLSENICSLKPQEDRLAYVWKIRLHKRTALPLKAELHEAIIRSRQKLSYEEVDDFLEEPTDNDVILKELQEPLLNLYARTKKLRAKRLERGYEFFNEENRLLMDENLNLISIVSEKETPSHSLIEECMLLANIYSAKHLEKGIFRVHEEPKIEKIEELLWDLRSLGLEAKPKETLHATIAAIQKEAEAKGIRTEVDRMIIKSQAQARYSHQKIGHFGLGFEEYSHFTSPIRRYSDLVLHRLLKAELNGQKRKMEFYLDALAPLCDSLSALERESARVEMDYKDRKYARLALERLGEVVEAVVVDEESPPLARAEGFLKGARIVLGKGLVERLSRVRVRLMDVDVASAKIYGKVVGIIKEKRV